MSTRRSTRKSAPTLVEDYEQPVRAASSPRRSSSRKQQSPSIESDVIAAATTPKKKRAASPKSGARAASSKKKKPAAAASSNKKAKRGATPKASKAPKAPKKAKIEAEAGLTGDDLFHGYLSYVEKHRSIKGRVQSDNALLMQWHRLGREGQLAAVRDADLLHDKFERISGKGEDDDGDEDVDADDIIGNGEGDDVANAPDYSLSMMW